MTQIKRPFGAKASGEREGGFLLRLLLLASFFACGVILGQVVSGRVPDGTAPELNRYLTDYLTLSKDAGFSGRAFLSSLLMYLRYPLLAFLLGFASIGIVLLPLLSAAYGFFLSFSVCCFAAAFGRNGILLALSVFGIRCLISLPCFFFLAVPSFRNASALAAASFGRKNRRIPPVRYPSSWWLRLCGALAVLMAGAISEMLFAPYLLDAVLSRILI